jgi:hypothetical protein
LSSAAFGPEQQHDDLVVGQRVKHAQRKPTSGGGLLRQLAGLDGRSLGPARRGCHGGGGGSRGLAGAAGECLGLRVLRGCGFVGLLDGLAGEAGVVGLRAAGLDRPLRGGTRGRRGRRAGVVLRPEEEHPSGHEGHCANEKDPDGR